MGCSVQCGPAAPVCVETDASSWRGFLLWTHSSPGLLGCFRVVYTVQYSVQCTVYSTTMPGLSAELGPMNGWSGDLATSYLVTLCWIVLKMGNLVSARNYGDHFHSTVQHTLLWYTVHAFLGSEDNVVWSHLTHLILHFHVLVFIMIVL